MASDDYGASAFTHRGITVPIVNVVAGEAGSVVDLVLQRMDEAANAMSLYLSRQMYPPAPPWYVRWWRRVRDAALVLAGKRWAVPESVALHECPIGDDDEGDW